MLRAGRRVVLSSLTPRRRGVQSAAPNIEAVLLDLEVVRASRANAGAATDNFSPLRDTEWLFRRKNRGKGELQIHPQERPTTGDKYAEAVRGKKLAAMTRQSDASGLRSSSSATESSNGGGGGGGGGGGDTAAVLRATPPDSVAAAAADPGAPLIWSVANGALELLKYLRMRRLRVALLLTHPPGERFPLPQFLHQLGAQQGGAGSSGGELGAIIDAAACGAAPAADPVARACAALGVAPINAMLLGSHAPILQSAKAAGAHVVQLQHRDARRVGAAQHYAGSFLAFQTILEHFNGVSFRSTQPYIHSSKFAPGE